MDDMASVGLRVDSRQVQTANGDLDRFARSGDKAGRSANRATSAFSAMGKGLAIAAGGFAAIAGATRTLAEFGSSMSQVQAITNATATEMVKLTATAAKMGSTTEFSASQAAGGLRFLGMAGFSATESIAAMPAVLDLATSASMGLAEAADTASNIMSAFGIAATDASDVADVLAAAATSANTSVSQLGNAMAFVGPVASAMGVEMSDTAAAIGVLSDAGIQGSAAGTGLRRVLSSLANPTGAAAAALADLGVKLEDVNPATTSIVEIVDRLAASGISAADALTIFGDRGGPAILALTSQAGSLRELTESLSDVEGESARMATTMRDNLKGDMQSAMSAAEGLIIAMGKAGLTAVLRGATQFATGFLRTVSQLVDGIGFLVGIADDARRAIFGLGNSKSVTNAATEALVQSMQGELSLIGEITLALAPGTRMSLAHAEAKRTETQAILTTMEARRADAAQIQMMSGEYIALEKSIQDVILGVKSLDAGPDIDGVLAPSIALPAIQEALAVLGRMKEEQQSLIDTAAPLSDEYAAAVSMLESLDAAIEDAAGGMVVIKDNAGQIPPAINAGAGAARGLAGALAGANVQASTLLSNLGMIPTALRALADQATGMVSGLTEQNRALNYQINLGMTSQAAALKAARDTALDQAEVQGATLQDLIKIQQRFDAQIKTVDDLATANAGLNAELVDLGGGGSSGGGSAGAAADELDNLTTVSEGLDYALRGGTKSAVEMGRELGGSLLRGIDSVSDAFGDFVMRGFTDFKGFVASILDSFKSMLAQMISMAVRNRIMLSIGTAGGGVGQAVAGAAGGGGASGGMLSGLMGSFGTGKGMAGLAGGAGFLGGVGNVLGGLASGGLSGGIGAIGSALGGATASPGGFAMAAGAIALPLLAVAGIFSFFRTKTKELDAGIIATVTGVDTLVQSFRTVEKSRFFGLFKSVSTTIGAAGQATTDAITDIVGTLQGSVVASADALGLAGDTFEDFSHRMRISTKGLSEEAANEAIQDALMGMADAMAGMVSGLDAFARDGEGAAATLERLAQSLATVNGFMDAFQLRTYDVSLAGGAAAASFVDLFGSLDAFVNVAGSYYQNFFTDAERLARATELLSIEMLALGIDALPSTRAAFRALVDEADALGDSGLVASLMQLSPAFAEITAGADALGDSLRSLVNEDLFTTGQDYTRALSRSTNNQLFTPQQSDAELRAELRALNVSMERLVSTSEITAGNTGRGADAADDTLAFTVEQTL